jgi:hypothetical protein
VGSDKPIEQNAENRTVTHHRELKSASRMLLGCKGDVRKERKVVERVDRLAKLLS